MPTVATLKAVANDAYETLFDRGGIEHLTLFWAVLFTFAVVFGHFTGKLKVKAHPRWFIFFLVCLAVLWAEVLSRYVPMLLAP